MRVERGFPVEAHFDFTGGDLVRQTLFAKQFQRGVYRGARKGGHRFGETLKNLLGRGVVHAAKQVLENRQPRLGRAYAGGFQNFLMFLLQENSML